MALFKIFKGQSGNLGQSSNGTNKTYDGYAYFTPDDGKFYIDIATSNSAVTTGANRNRVPLSAEKADLIKQHNTTNSENYKILLSYSANPQSGAIDKINYGTNLTYNPVTNELKTGNIELTGELDVTGNAYLRNETTADSLTAGSLLVNGAANFVQSPTGPTAAAGDSSTKLATTEFVNAAVIAGNTDTKVTQNSTTTTSWRKVLLNGGSADTYSAWDTDVTAKTDIVYQSKSIAVQPSTGTLAANIFKGALKAGADASNAFNALGIDFVPTSGTSTRIGGNGIGGLGFYADKIYLRAGSSAASNTSQGLIVNNTHLDPYATDVYDLGTSTLKFKTIYATTFDGNATTATTLATTRKIDGINFNGSADVLHYGACSTAVGTAAKTVAITGFTLTTGAVIYVKFTNGNTANDPTLNVNSTGAKNIYFQNGTRLQTASNYPDYLQANKIYQFMYDGTNYVLINNPNVLELYEKRTSTTSLNKAAIYGGAGAMFHIIANSSTTTGKTPTDANIFQMNWDNNGGYDSQLGISTSNSRLYVRSRVSEGTAWREAATIVAATKTGNTDTPVYVNETGQVVAITGALANSITGNAATATKATQDSSGNNIIDTYLTKAAGITAVTWDNTNKKITKTINGTTTDVVEIKAGNGISLTAAAGEVTIDGYTIEVVRLI